MFMIVRRTEIFATVMASVQIFGIFAASITARHEDIAPGIMRYSVAIKLDPWDQEPEYQI
jgi:hypothetical protein